MLVESPRSETIFALFDQLLEKVYPEDFSTGWWCGQIHQDILEHIHVNISKILCNLMIHPPFNSSPIHTISSKKIRVLPYQFFYKSEESSESERITLPLLVFDIDPEICIEILNRIPRNLQQQFGISMQQSQILLHFHLIIATLMLKFEQNEKYGKDFFTTLYAAELLESSLTTLTPLQARRFYYWGILNFQVSEDLMYWLTPDAFLNYLNKFRD
jgi:hypothetical protein